MRAARIALDLSIGLLLVAILALVIALKAVPAITGLVPLSILTGSMEPGLPPGTLVYVQKGALPEAGDVATYLTASTPITHRVMDIRSDISGLSREYIFRGDANLTDDPKPIPAEAILGTVAGSVPALGFPAYVLSQPIGMALTISLGLLLIAVRSLIPSEEKHTMIEDRPETQATAKQDLDDAKASLIDADHQERDDRKDAMVTEARAQDEATDNVETGAVPTDKGWTDADRATAQA